MFHLTTFTYFIMILRISSDYSFDINPLIPVMETQCILRIIKYYLDELGLSRLTVTGKQLYSINTTREKF
jgi:hypothetical protein